MKTNRIALVALLGGAVLTGLAGCSLLVEFDDTKIPQIEDDAAADSAVSETSADSTATDSSVADTATDDATDSSVAETEVDSTTADTATADTATADTATADTATADTFVPDTFVPDTFVPDTFVEDTFVPDTFVADTFVPDTFVPDTYVEDTFVADTFVEDTFVPDTFVPDTYVEDTFVADTFVEDTSTADTAETGGPTSVCGNGAIEGIEACDDNNTGDSDGCSASCQVESGYQCFSAPSLCGKTTGNGDVLFNRLYHGSSPTTPATEPVPGKSYAFFNVQGGGAISSTASYEVYLLAALSDLQSATVRVWSKTGTSTTAAESTYAMTWVDAVTIASTPYAIWKGVITPQAAGQTVYYRIWADDGAKRATLKSALPASSSPTCAVQTPLNQAVCDGDGFSDADYSFVVP